MSVCVKKKGTETNTTMLQRALRCGKWLNSTHPQELRGGCCTSPPLTPPILQIKLQNVIHAYDSIFNTGHFICLAPFFMKRKFKLQLITVINDYKNTLTCSGFSAH